MIFKGGERRRAQEEVRSERLLRKLSQPRLRGSELLLPSEEAADRSSCGVTATSVASP
jgi:hypothetical protein